MKSRDSVDTDDLLDFELLVDVVEDPQTDAIIRQTDRRMDVIIIDYNRLIVGHLFLVLTQLGLNWLNEYLHSGLTESLAAT